MPPSLKAAFDFLATPLVVQSLGRYLAGSLSAANATPATQRYPEMSAPHSFVDVPVATTVASGLGQRVTISPSCIAKVTRLRSLCGETSWPASLIRVPA